MSLRREAPATIRASWRQAGAGLALHSASRQAPPLPWRAPATTVSTSRGWRGQGVHAPGAPRLLVESQTACLGAPVCAARPPASGPVWWRAAGRAQPVLAGRDTFGKAAHRPTSPPGGGRGVWGGPGGAWPAARPGLAWAGGEARLRARPPRGPRRLARTPRPQRHEGQQAWPLDSHLRRALDNAGAPAGASLSSAAPKSLPRASALRVPAGIAVTFGSCGDASGNLSSPQKATGALACPWQRFLS